MFPFIVDTLTGTRPARATGRGFSLDVKRPWAYVWFGEVEIIPSKDC